MESVDKLEVIISPNPMRDPLNLELTNPFDDDTAIKIFDLTGQLFTADRLVEEELIKTVSLDGIDPGTYILQINSEHQMLTRKIVIS